MTHRTLIDGTAYEINGGRVLISGVGYDIKKGRAFIDGVGYDISFAAPASELPVGASVYMNIDGVRTEFLVVHQGRINSDKYDDTCDGIWLMMKNIYIQRVFDTSNIHCMYRNSDICNYANNDFSSLFDEQILELIKTVNVPTGKYTGIQGGDLHPVTCKFFPPHLYEIIGNNSSNSDFNWLQLTYFEDDDVTKRIATYNGNNAKYWTRLCQTIYPGDASGVPTHCYNYIIDSSGNDEELDKHADDEYGFRPMCILSNEAMVDSSFNVIA